MASGGTGDNPLLDKRLGPFIAMVLEQDNFTSIRQLKAALKEMVKEELVEEHTEYICDAWMAHREKAKSCKDQGLADRLPNAPAAGVAGPTPPATAGSPTQAGEALDSTSVFGDEDLCGLGHGVSGNQVSRSFRLGSRETEHLLEHGDLEFWPLVPLHSQP